MKTCEFWILWSTFFLNTQAIGYINSMYKAYGQVFINDDHFLAVVGAFAAIFNASGRVFWGHLCDKFGYRSCMLVVTASMVGYAVSNLKVYKKNLKFRVKRKISLISFWILSYIFKYLTTDFFSFYERESLLKSRHSSISTVLISVIFNLSWLIILSYFPPL